MDITMYCFNETEKTAKKCNKNTKTNLEENLENFVKKEVAGDG